MQSYASPDWETAGALAPRYAPLPSLARQDADVALIALWSNNVLYAKPVNDPLFAAHANASFVNYGATFEQFRPDHPGRTLGCAQQVLPSFPPLSLIAMKLMNHSGNFAYPSSERTLALHSWE